MKINLLSNHEIDKQQWDDFILQSPQGAIYALSDYLTIIHPEWQAFVVEEKGQWKAVMPWFVKSFFGVKSAFQPALCQFQGAFLISNELSNYKQIDFERKIGELFASSILDNCNKYESNFSPSLQYVLPYYWKGFELLPRFTYYLDLPSSISNYSTNHQRALHKANKCGFNLGIEDNPAEMIALFKQNKGAEIKLLTEHHYFSMAKIANAFMPRGMAHVLTCRDKNGLLVSAIIAYTFKGKFTYYLGTTTEQGKKDQAMVWLLTEAALYAQKLGCTVFDFEGSMMAPIEKFFRGFGANYKNYYTIRKRLLFS